LPLQERPDLANLKSALVVSNAKMKAELAALEGRILGLLSASSGNILDDEELINTLAQAKVGTGARQLIVSHTVVCSCYSPCK
jgi:dynein heavy chain